MLGLSASKCLRPSPSPASLLKAEVLGWGKGSLAQVTDDSSSTPAANCSILQVFHSPSDPFVCSRSQGQPFPREVRKAAPYESWPGGESGTRCLGLAREAGSLLMGPRALPFRESTARNSISKANTLFFLSCLSEKNEQK